ncbi:MAG: hypothetical protein GXP42_14270 [Chloroflexi bacterium]|nr:hypothetical protein [Chloroflexota bacterium]
MLLIIGLDGADWRILEPWLNQGRLPHLAGLRDRGRWGDLRSTIRPESSVAWTTFATGVNPGKHGVFGFVAQRLDSYEPTLNTSTAIRQPTFWARAGAAGKRVAILNAPMTYPPQPFPNGALIAGMLTPSLRSPFTHPPDLRQRLLEAVPDYVINIDRSGLGLKDFIQATTQAIRARGQAARWLLEQDDWDAFVVVFTATDRLQHYALHLLEPQHPRHDPNESAALLPLLLAAYQVLDEAIGRLLAAVGRDATVFALSDHGFGGCARAFWPNVWLEERGHLVRHGSGALKSALGKRRPRPAWLKTLKERIPWLRERRRSAHLAAYLAQVDWARTAAVFSPTGGIRLNIRGREPSGILSPVQAESLAESLAQNLTELVDPITGVAPIVHVFPREALYHGPYLHLAPDLILEPRRDDPDPARNALYFADFQPHIFADSGEFSGNHTWDGIFMAAGPGIEPGHLQNARLLDLAPTILHALGLAIPPDMDGRVLPLWPETRARAEGQHPAPDGLPAPVTGVTDVTGMTDEAAIEERLRALGYL